MVRYPEQAATPAVLLMTNLPVSWAGTCQFALQYRIHEAHGKLKVIKEVGDAVPDPERNHDGVTMCQRAQRVVVDPIVETENCPVKTQQGIIDFCGATFAKSSPTAAAVVGRTG